MKRRFFIIMLMCLCIGGASVFIGKFINYEREQSKKIVNIESEISLIKTSLIETKYGGGGISWPSDGYNYLAIGNSITQHACADYWWSNAGMAASALENDYVHLVEKGLEENDVTTCAYNFSVWETMATDRAETLILLDPYLSNYLDLVTIQLGENVDDTTTFESDFEYLITYIKDHATNADIYIVGDFWKSSTDALKQMAAENMGVNYVSLAEIQGISEYQVGKGTIVYGEDGSEHLIEHDGVASHPGDKGMEYIANAILDAIRRR